MALGRHEEALAAARAHGREFPASYGGRGPWYSLNLMGRVAMACGDAALLREALARLAQIQAVIPEATPLRLQPVIGLQGCLAWLEGRRAEARGAVDARRWRTRRRATCSAWPTSCAPAWRCRACSAATQPPRPRGCDRCWRRPPMARAARCSRSPALRELAGASWGKLLGAGEQAVLRAWAAPAAVDGRCTVDALAGRPGQRPHDPLSARETEVLAIDRPGPQQQAHRA